MALRASWPGHRLASVAMARISSMHRGGYCPDVALVAGADIGVAALEVVAGAMPASLFIGAIAVELAGGADSIGADAGGGAVSGVAEWSVLLQAPSAIAAASEPMQIIERNIFMEYLLQGCWETSTFAGHDPIPIEGELRLTSQARFQAWIDHYCLQQHVAACRPSASPISANHGCSIQHHVVDVVERTPAGMEGHAPAGPIERHAPETRVLARAHRYRCAG